MSKSEVLRKVVEHRHGSVSLEGVLVRDAATVGPVPTVIVCHGAEGRSDVLVKMAERVLPWGYQAFVMDLYGKGVSGSTPEEFNALMRPFLDDRAMLADRLSAVVSAVAGLREVDCTPSWPSRRTGPIWGSRTAPGPPSGPGLGCEGSWRSASTPHPEDIHDEVIRPTVWTRHPRHTRHLKSRTIPLADAGFGRRRVDLLNAEKFTPGQWSSRATPSRTSRSLSWVITGRLCAAADAAIHRSLTPTRRPVSAKCTLMRAQREDRDRLTETGE